MIRDVDPGREPDHGSVADGQRHPGCLVHIVRYIDPRVRRPRGMGADITRDSSPCRVALDVYGSGSFEPRKPRRVSQGTGRWIAGKIPRADSPPDGDVRMAGGEQ